MRYISSGTTSTGTEKDDKILSHGDYYKNRETERSGLYSIHFPKPLNHGKGEGKGRFLNPTSPVYQSSEYGSC